MNNELNNPRDVQKMLDQMTSFYIEHLPIESSYEEWLDALIDVWRMFKGQLEQIDDNSLPTTARTLRTIPFHKIDIRSSVYDKTTAREIKRSKSDDQVIVALYNRKLYTDLEFWEMGAETPLIYSMDLYIDFDKKVKLEINKDYFIRRNKIYLMPDFILKNNQVLGYLYAYNIKVNDFNLELNWGDDIPIRIPFLMPRYQYRKLVGAYQKLMSSDYFIKDILEAIHEFTESPFAEITDIRSRDISDARKRLYDEFLLSPLDFIVTLTEEDIRDKMQTNVVLHMITFAKQSETFFWLFFFIMRYDEMEAEDEIYMKICIDKETQGEVEENVKKSISLEIDEEFFCNPYYDEDRKYDLQPLPFDVDNCEPDESRLIHMDTKDLHMDSDSPYIMMDGVEHLKHEHFELRVIDYPEIPRGFDVLENKIIFDKNKDRTQYYEVYGSEDGIKFTLIKSLTGEEYEREISLPLDDLPSEIRYYKVRAIDRENISLFSLIKEVK